MATGSVSETSEAIYKPNWKNDRKDCDVEAEQEEGLPNASGCENYSRWSDVPNIVLENVYTYLTIKERYNASQVCWNWYRAFHLPLVWDNFLVDDRTLTRAKFNYYSGWVHCLDHIRTQNCLARIGKYLRGVQFKPEHSFHNIYQFISMLTWAMTESIHLKAPELAGIGARIRSLVYVFPCSMSQPDDPTSLKLFGTGGQMLKGLKDLLIKLTELRTLKLIDFVLEYHEAQHLLDEVLAACCTKMRVLNIVNVTTMHCPIVHVGLFVNLKVLTISPQNIDDEVLQLLADTRLEHLNLLQNRYTPSHTTIAACSAKSWRALKFVNPRLQVHLRVESAAQMADVVFQPEAPVYSVTYRSPKSRLQSDVLIRMVDHYKTTLCVYGFESLPRFISPKSFTSRCDSLVFYQFRQCHNLQTLLIREKISSCTVLLLASTLRNLRQFHVRRFAVILRCDWAKAFDWSDEYFQWLRRSCRSYEAVEKEVSQLLGFKWHFLSDAEYKRIEINVRDRQ